MKLLENEIYSQKNGHLHFDSKDLTELADQYGTPLYVFCEKELKNNVREIQEKFRMYHANTSVHYAAKCESTIANLQIIRNAGSSLEVNSGGELFKGLHADFKGSQIVFNGVSKSEEEIEMAINNDVKSINVDSEFELKRIVGTAIKLKKKVNISIRIVPEISTGVVKGNETGTHESKFGMTLDAVEDSVQYALENSRWVCLRGYHFHIGTQTYDLESICRCISSNTAAGSQHSRKDRL